MPAHRHRSTILLALPWLVAGKVIDGEMRLTSQETERFMSKFSFSPHVRSHVSGKFAAHNSNYFDNHPHDLNLCLYDEEGWAKFLEVTRRGSLCVDRQRLASWSTKIHPTYDRQKATEARKQNLASADFTFSFDATLRPPATTRAHYWFAVLMDCYLEVNPLPLRHKSPVRASVAASSVTGVQQLPLSSTAVLIGHHSLLVSRLRSRLRFPRPLVRRSTTRTHRRCTTRSRF